MSVAGKRLAGLGLIVAIGLLIVLGVTKPNPLASTHSYWAVFDTAHGLGTIDRDIRVAGVKVGEVGTVKRTGDNVRVELKLTEDEPLHVDARAAMRPHTLFEGSNYVDLSPGSPEAPRLAEGHTIPLAQTTNYVTLDRALRVLRPEIRDSLRQLAKVGGRTFQGQAITGLQHTLKNLPAMSAALGPAARAAEGPQQRELAGEIRGLSQTVDALGSERDELRPILQRASRTNAALTAGGGAPLDAALAQLPDTLQAMKTGAPQLGAVIQRLSAFASSLGTSGPRALARSLHATTPVLTEAAPVLKSGTPIVRDARLIAARLAAARDGLVEMFRVLRGPLKTFPATFDTLNAKTKLGASSGALQLVGGAFEAGSGAFSGFTANPTAPGHSGQITVALDPAVATKLGGLLGAGRGLPALRTNMPPVVRCGEVARVSQRAAATVRANGACR